MNGVSAPIKEISESSCPTFAMGEQNEKTASMKQGVGPDQTLNLLVPFS